ncbi:piggyBac transposable element-derived protein 4 isoform X2 [Anopheles coustani]|uniref:piggyBac transposable element-derived protein 4 isoform X2 n=1 Tax=Anopheles coustani TaxID=139045 RepID=UPI0026595CA3|nr:piggyBac transposable element-derived protein 4 isoform X2 [Anopheles coustani]
MGSSDSEEESISSVSSDSEEEECDTIQIKRVKVEPGEAEEWAERDQPQTLVEFAKVSGPTIELSSTATVSKYAELLFDDSFFKLLATHTNINHKLQSASYKTASKSPVFEDVTVNDMKKFLGLLLLMGQIKKSHWREYWTTDALIETPIFPQTMTRNRFEQILRFFHIADDTQSMDGANKELWIVKPLMDHFIPKFQSIYAPKQQLSMNEAIVPSTGNLRFRKHNPAKTTRLRKTID